MLWMLLILLLSLALAGAVVVYVAYPRRGEEVPHVPWLGDAMKRGVASLPTIGNLEGQRAPAGADPHPHRYAHPNAHPDARRSG
jgi:hypothetical protein